MRELCQERVNISPGQFAVVSEIAVSLNRASTSHAIQGACAMTRRSRRIVVGAPARGSEK